MMKKVYVLFLTIFGSLGTWGQILTENFSYTAATAITANGWTAHNAGGTNTILVTSPSLIYAGHPGSGVGNAITMAASGEDDNRTLSTAIITGTAYASFLVNVTTSGTAGEYFIGLYTNTTTFPIRVFAKNSGAGFVFGINKSGGVTTYESTVRSFGTTYFIVVNYIYNSGTATDDVLNLWVNPALGGTEGAATIPNVTGATPDVTTITAFYVRQGTAANTQTQRVDAILVGTTWAQVTPLVGGPTINVSSTTLSGFTALSGFPTAEQSYTVDGSALTANIIITPPPGFEITKTSGSGYVVNPGTITLTQTGGVVTSTPIYVRMNSATLGTNTGNITHTSTGANSPNVALTGQIITTEPTTQGAITIPLLTITPTSMVVNFTSGNGAKRILVAKALLLVDSNPVDGTTYTANANFGSGSLIGTGNYVLYAGTGNMVTVTGLSPTTLYNFALFEYNDAATPGAENYLTTSPGLGAASTLSSDGDFRSVASGNWSNPATWQIRAGNVWIAAVISPLSISNVYIQLGHTVTVDIATATCNDLHINAGAGAKLIIDANTIEVNGKLRAFTGAAVTTLGLDGTFYSGQLSTTSVGSTCITSTAGTGKMKVIGNTRIFTATSEWGNNPPGWDVEFAPTAGQILTIQTGFKAENITVASGTVLSTSTDMRPGGVTAGVGSLTVKSGSTLQFSNNSIVIQRVGTTGATSHFGILTVESGATLEFSGTSSPIIGASVVNLNGTVIYSGTGNQTFASKGGNSLAVDLPNYNNVTISGGGNKTLEVATTLSGVLNLISGYVISTTNLLKMTATSSVTNASNASFVNGPVSKFGNTSFTFPVGKPNCGPSATVNGYVPIQISTFSAGTPTDQYIAEYIRASAAALPGGITAFGLAKVSFCEYWTLDRLAGSGTVNVKLYWNEPVNNCSTASPYIKVLSDLVVAHYGATWDSYGATSTATGSPTSGAVTWPNVSVFSPFTIGSISFANPLPIIINYLNGTRNAGNHLLNWKATCVSVPSATIELERSSDGRNYSSIYSIFATALRCQQPFNYTDNQPLKGINYYRLKITDSDGKVTYSTIVPLINAEKGIDVMNIAPNPVVNSTFNLKVSAAVKTQMEIVITDMQGRLLQKQSVNLIAGFNSVPMNVKNLAAGTYQLVGNTADGKTRVLRFVIQ